METPSAKKTPARQRNAFNENGRSVSVWIDGFDDLFSDFDPRSYDERNISDDFLYELKKLTAEHEVQIAEIKLLIPSKMKSEKNETLISKRFHQHFVHKFHSYRKKLKKHHKTGILILSAGLFLLLAAGYLASLKETTLLFRIFFVITEPSGWYFAWTGLERLFSEEKKNLPELEFYKKISNARIVFSSINEN
jgi:hypothetical protein